MKKEKIRAIVVKVVLAFVAVFVLMAIVGLFVPVGNAKPNSDNIAFSSDFSLLNFDGTRKHQVIKMDEVDGAKKITTYNDYVIEWKEDGEDIEFEVSVEKTGKYQIAIDYLSLQTTVTNISINVTAGKTSYKNIELQSAWGDSSGEEIYDIYGNEVSPVQEARNLWRNVFLYDQQFYLSTPLEFEMESGVNKISLSKNKGSLYVGKIYLCEVEEYANYSAPSANDGAKGELITLEAEDPLFKSTPEIRSVSQQNVSCTPYSTDNNMLNAISGDTFNKSGYSLTYAFNVEKAGNYNISLKYFISQTNTSVYSKILIDNIILNKELNSYEFRERGGFNNETLNVNGEKMLFYFEPGVHTITIQLDASLQSEIHARMSNIIKEINTLYLEIIKLTGGNADKNMTWKIDDFIYNPENGGKASERLNKWKTELEELLKLTNEISKSNPGKHNRLYQNLSNAYDKLCTLAKNPNSLPHKLTVLSEGSSSIANMLSDSLHTSTFSPLTLDKIYVHGEGKSLPNPKENFFMSFFGTVQRVFKSGVEKEDGEVVEIWVNRSTYYVSLMQQYADAYYTPKTGIKIRFSLLPDESKITYANASGTQPDAALGVSSTVPYDMGIRGALVNLASFANFEEVASQFTPGAYTNMTERDNVYGLPETQDFNITYYRTDLVEMLGVEVPQTYEDIIEIVPALQRYGMNYHMPLAGGSGLKSIAVTAPILYQDGGDIYGDGYLSTAIDEPEAIEAMNMMVELFSLYSLPLTSQSFYNTFRSGTIPIGVAGFEVYLQLTTAAPEIAGSWDVTLAPGVERVDEDGNTYIDRTNTSDAKGCVIFNKSKKQQEAWDFISWWLSSDIQASFANAIEATYGPTFLWNTANIEAFKQLDIDENHINVILEQWSWSYNIPQTPATYIIERGISNVWNTAVFDQAPIRAAISDAVFEINREIKRKMQEFGYIDSKGVVLVEYYVPTREETFEKWVK